MSGNKHKVAFVGPAALHTAFSEFDESWDLQVPLPKLDDFLQELQLDPSETRIDPNTSLVIMFSRLYNEDPELFAEISSYIAPYSVLCILTPGADMGQKDIIERHIKSTQLQDANDNPDYNVNTPFYFVRYENAHVEIMEAIEKFAQSKDIAPEIRNNVSKMLPDIEIPVSEQYDIYTADEYEDEKVDVSTLQRKGKGKVIAVTSPKGGSGKSTTSIGLGTYIALASQNGAQMGLEDKELKVCIVDLDVRDGQLGFLIGKISPTIIETYTSSPSGIPNKESIMKSIVRVPGKPCDFILAPKKPRNAYHLPPSFYANLINELRDMYDYIILDTSVNYLDPLLEEVAYPIADKIVLVTDMGKSSIYGMARWIKESTDIDGNSPDISKDKVGIVVNKAMADIQMNADSIEKASFGIPILTMIPSAPRAILYAANSGELEMILKIEGINIAFKTLVDELLADDDYKLGTVPLGKQ